MTSWLRSQNAVTPDNSAVPASVPARPRSRLIAVFLIGHDLIGKPVPTFPDHARKSDIAAFDLFGQRFDQFRHLFEVRVDGERLAERVERALLVAEVLHDHAEGGQ